MASGTKYPQTFGHLVLYLKDLALTKIWLFAIANVSSLLSSPF